MYKQTLYPQTRQILNKLKKIPIVNTFYLAGGTALALQIGHRKSADLDFFIQKFPDRDILIQRLDPFSPKITQEAQGTLDVTIDDVKTSFLEYKYPLLKNFVQYEGIKLASILDIACMKLSAISSRSTKKDFADLYFILKNHPLKTLLKSFDKKFNQVSYQKIHILKSLTYFEDADQDPDPDYTTNINWSEIKNDISLKVKDYLSELN